MTTTLTLTSGQVSFTAQGYTILPSPGTPVPDNVVPAILAQAYASGVVLASSAGTGSTIVNARSFYSSGTGAPTSGAWLLGDEVEDSTGAVYRCTAAGSPGTWVQPGSGTYAPINASGRLIAGRQRPAPFSGAVPVLNFGVPPQSATAHGNAGNGAVNTTTGYTTRVPIKFAIDCTDLRFVFPGWYVANNATSESAAPNVQFVKAAIEYGGATYPVSFAGGGRLATIEPWGTVTSEPLGLEVAAGDTAYLRTFFDTPAGGSYLQLYNMGAAPGASGSYQAGDVTDSTGACTNTSTVITFTAMTVLGTPLAAPGPIVIGVGDSLTAGRYDGGAAYTSPGQGGYLARALATLNLPGLTLGESGTQVSMWANKTKQQRVGPFLGLGNVAVVLLGTNDVFVGLRTLSAIQADLQTVWSRLSKRGLRVVGNTLPPQTTSTDSWATTANQTVKAQESVRVALNDWIRSKPTGLDGVIDYADQVETSRNSGIWKAGYSYDGIHGNSTGQAAAAACVTLSALTG